MGFESLQISEPLKKALSSSVNSGRFPHAAILEDEDSERLMDTAKTLAAALVCSGDDKPCGKSVSVLASRVVLQTCLHFHVLQSLHPEFVFS